MNKIDHLSFEEIDIFEKEIISFHIPRTKKLNDDHKYFKKRIVWTLSEWKYNEDYPYKEIEEDEKNGIRYQEIPEQIVDEINGITNVFIKDKINTKDCFSFDFQPNELDKLILRSDYEFKEIKEINQPCSRIFKYIAFTFKNGVWEIDEKVEKRAVKHCKTGIVNIILKNY